MRDGIPVEGWVFASVALIGGGRKALDDVLIYADFLFRAALSKAELEYGVSRLLTRGLITVSSDLVFMSTPSGDALKLKYKECRSYDFITHVDAELSSQPLDRVMPWTISDADFDTASQRKSEQVAKLESNERIYCADPAAESLLRLVASKHLLGHLHSWELPPIADQLLSSGLYSDAIFELSVAKDAPMSDVAPLLKKTLNETGVPWPTRQEAAWIVARSYITSIAESNESPFHSLKCLHELEYGTGFDPRFEKVTGGPNLDELIAIYYSSISPPEDYCDATHRTYANETEQHAALTAQARKVSREWLEKHPE